MKRHHYLSEDLDELERVERELQALGIGSGQIHVISEQDAELAQHRLNAVPSLMKKDLVPFGLRGALVGVVMAVLALLIPYLAGWTETRAGWSPFVLLALVLLGFGAWEGGILGFRRPNRHFRHFLRQLRQGKHLLFIDLEPTQEQRLEQVMRQHPRLRAAGTGQATPAWLLSWQQKWQKFRQSI
ncbi:MAG: magnesium transporter [Pseudomonadota bacterium]